MPFEGKLLHTLKGHSDHVLSVSFNPDGKTLASASGDNTLKLWSVEGKLLQTFKGHSDPVLSVSFSPDGKTLTSASGDNTLKLWSVDVSFLLAEGCRWLNNYLVNNPASLETLKICQTPANLAAAADSLVNSAEQQAKTGNLDQALNTLQKAFQWNPKLGINRKDKARQLTALATAQSLYEQGTELIASNQFKSALTKYLDAQKLDATIISADDWNNICWDGSVQGQAIDVIEACEKAVSMTPNGYFRDGRGLARALTGNTQGAISDFQAFIKWSNDPKEKSQRQRWVNELRKGKNPFTPEELKSLSDK